MSDEQLSRRDDRRLHRALESVVLTEFPNPERRGCPEADILQALARKRLPMRHAAFEHVGKCSPCFAEVREIRLQIRRHRIMWVVAMSAAILIAVAISYFSVHRSEQPSELAANVRSEAISLDLRPYAISRGDSPAAQPTTPALRLGRGLFMLVISLPVGAEEGSYEVQIQKNGAAALPAIIGNAQVENHVTTLRLNMDTRSLKAGEYQLGFRQMGLMWRLYPVIII